MKGKGIGNAYRRTYRDSDGTIKQSPYYSIEFPFQGRTRREATKATTEKDAYAILARKLDEINRGSFSPGQDKVFLPELHELVRARYINNNNRSIKDLDWKLKAPLEYFKFDPVKQMTTDKIEGFKRFRLDEGMTRATINAELRYLRICFNVGTELGVIAGGPKISLLKGENERDGFIDPGDFEVFLAAFDDRDVADMVEWLYWTGWRINAARGLEWARIDSERGMVLMTAELSKNKKPSLMPISQRLAAILDRRSAKRLLECPLVFHRKGNPLLVIRKPWKRAAQSTGFSRLMVHDLCRSAARNLAHAGVREGVASKYMNRTDQMYKRYRIVDTADLRDAGVALDQLNTERKVIKIGRAK